MGIFRKKNIRYYIDKMEITQLTVHITGWAVSLDGSPVCYRVTDREGQEAELTLRRLDRPDASIAALGNDSQRMCGFDLKFTCDMKSRYLLSISAGAGRAGIAVSPEELVREQGRRYVPFRKIIRMTTPAMVKSDLHTLVRKGPQALRDQWETRYETEENKYEKWLERHRLRQMPPLEQQPLISVIVPVYRTPETYLRDMIESVRAQGYENWELCLADGSEDGGETGRFVEKYAAKDSRIRYLALEKNLGIAGNTNAALHMASGEWIGLLDHDDVLEASALYEAARAMGENPSADVIYTDEDKVTTDLRLHFDPHMKPDFNPDLLRSNNYICHFFLCRRNLALEAGGFSPDYDGSQDYDFILKCTEQARQILHLPRVLYHWRTHSASTAENPESKMYCYEAGKRAIEAHLRRTGTEGTVEMLSGYPGYYHVEYPVKGEPLVSILIPNKDQKETLLNCVRSIQEKSTYRNYEIIIIENNSETEEIEDCYRQLEAQGVRVIRWDGPFNYAAINNYGAAHARGEYLLLLNNDTEVIAPEWIESMLGNCQRPEVGVTGAKLYYEDHTIQHAGVVMKLAGVCGHVLCGMAGYDPGPFARAIIQQNYSAVTAACLMVKTSVFQQVGGLSEEFQVAYNDVDFCLKVRQAGYLIVWNPRAELYHYESKSRGYETTPEKQARFQREKELLLQRWPDYISKGDPCYNPNLTLTAPDCSVDYTR